MASDVALKLLAFFGFLAVVGGSTYAAYQYILPEGFSPRGLEAEAIVPDATIAPGQTASVGLLLRNPGAVAERVRVTVAAAGPVTGPAGEATIVEVEAGAERAALLPISVAAGAAPGDHRVVLEAATTSEPVKRATVAVTVRVPGPGDAVDEGERAVVYYVGRLEDGAMFNTNHPAFGDAPLPRTADYRKSTGNLTIETGAGANVIPGFWRGVLGMVEGETRTITIPPSQAYGEKIVRETVNRTTTFERRFEIEVNPLTRPYSSFVEHVTTSGQGSAEDYEVGDTFTLAQGTNVWTMKLTAITNDTITYIPAPPVGTKFTLPASPPAWQNASVVESVDEEKIVLYTTPPQKVGERFTFLAHWPGASEVLRLTDDEIVLRHTPSVGLEYVPSTQPGAPTYTVERVEEDGIDVVHESPHPLAGETLVFDVTVLDILEAS